MIGITLKTYRTKKHAHTNAHRMMEALTERSTAR